MRRILLNKDRPVVAFWLLLLLSATGCSSGGQKSAKSQECRDSLNVISFTSEFGGLGPEAGPEEKKAGAFLVENYVDCRRDLIEALERPEQFAYAAATVIEQAKDAAAIPQLEASAESHQGTPAGLAAVNAIAAAGTAEARQALVRIIRQMRHPNTFRAVERLLLLDEALSVRTVREAMPDLAGREAKERRSLATRIARALRKQSTKECQNLAAELEAMAKAAEGAGQ